MTLTEEFALNDTKSAQWTAFVRKSGVEQDVLELLEVLTHLRQFLLPLLEAASGKGDVTESWGPGGPWVFPERDPI
jgi:hypothetical protein